MHLYTNVFSWVLSCYQRHWRTSLFLLHQEPFFPSWTFFNIASRSHYSPYQPQKYQRAACSAGSSTESSVHLSYQHHIWDTFHHTKPTQMPSISPTHAIWHCLSRWHQVVYHKVRARAICKQLIHRIKRCILHVWIWSACKHLQPCLQVSMQWLPAHSPSTMADHQLDSINRKSQAIGRSNDVLPTATLSQASRRDFQGIAAHWLGPGTHRQSPRTEKNGKRGYLWNTPIASGLQRCAGHSSALLVSLL